MANFGRLFSHPFGMGWAKEIIIISYVQKVFEPSVVQWHLCAIPDDKTDEIMEEKFIEYSQWCFAKDVKKRSCVFDTLCRYKQNFYTRHPENGGIAAYIDFVTGIPEFSSKMRCNALSSRVMDWNDIIKNHPEQIWRFLETFHPNECGERASSDISIKKRTSPPLKKKILL